MAILSLEEKLNKIKLNMGNELSLEDKLSQIKLNLQTTTEEAAPIETTELSLEDKLGKIKTNIAPETTIPQVGANLGLPSGPQSTPGDKPVLADMNKSIPSIAKGVWYGTITLPQAIGGLMRQWGETEQVISDPSKFVSDEKWEGADKKIFEAMYGSRKLLNKQIGQAGKIVSEKGQELIKANQAFTEKYLPPTDTSKLNKFLFELGSGASSIALAVGVSLVTGNAGAAAVAFGGIASGRTYQEAREADVDPLKASSLGAVNFGTEAGLEYLGLNFLLTKLPTSKIISLAAKGIENAGQEYLQEAGSNIVAKVGWDKARKWNKGSVKAGVMGFILGAGADVVISSVVNETNAPKTFVKDIIDRTYSQMDTVTKSIKFDNVVEQAKADPEIKKTIEEIKIAEPTPKATTEQKAVVEPGAEKATSEATLADEVKKYKSAEEFINNISKPTRPIREAKVGELVTIQSDTYGETSPTQYNSGIPHDGEIVKINPKSVSIKSGDTVYKFPATAKVSALDLKEFKGKSKQELINFYNQNKAEIIGAEEEIEEVEPAPEEISKLFQNKEVNKPTPPVTGEGKVSKIAGSIETKSIEQGLTKGYGHLAEYTPIVIKEQAQKASDLINSNIDEARKVVRGEKPLPEGLKGTALITAMEEHIKKTANGELASELASSPLVSGTSAAAQELRLAAERDPESPVKAIEDINKILNETIKKRYPGKILNKAKESLISKIKSEIKNANTAYSWKAFIESIRC